MAHDVLILGGGFGGLTAARRLERKLAPQAAKVTLVNDVNFMLYTPLLPGAAGGTLGRATWSCRCGSSCAARSCTSARCSARIPSGAWCECTRSAAARASCATTS